MIAIGYTLPMVVWMRVRNLSWRPTLEMSGATVGLAVAMIALTGIGVISQDTLREWAPGFCLPACVVMLAVMLFRLDVYTGRVHHEERDRRTPAAAVM